MKKLELLRDLIATYERHGWQLRQLLLNPASRAELETGLLDAVNVKEFAVDALWFSRPSHDRREACELRLLSETQYALFETFEADETEEQREEVKLEMENRLRDYVIYG